MVDARKAARVLTRMGFPAIADSRGGWSGQPGSLVWGVRPFPVDGLTGNYEEREQMPQAWQAALAADDALVVAHEREAIHRESCKLGKPCQGYPQYENALTRAYHAYQEARAK